MKHLDINLVSSFTACNCHGHSENCYYDEEVALKHESLDIHGKHEGGGVCQDCRDHTTGINCEQCVDGYYRPFDRSPADRDACQRKYLFRMCSGPVTFLMFPIYFMIMNRMTVIKSYHFVYQWEFIYCLSSVVFYMSLHFI